MTLPLECSKCRTPLPLAVYGGEEARCPGCGSFVQALVFPAFLAQHGPASAEAVLDESEASCFYHPGKKAVVACEACGRFICGLCEVELEGRRLCPQCLESGKRKGSLASLETSRTLYDSLALGLAVAPLGLWPLTIFTAPATIYLCLRYRKAPRSLVRPGRWKWWFALIFSTLQIIAWVAFAVFLFHTFTKIKHVRAATHRTGTHWAAPHSYMNRNVQPGRPAKTP